MKGTTDVVPSAFQKKPEKEGNINKVVVTFFFFLLLQQNKTKGRGRQLVSPSTFQKKQEKEAAIAFFFLLL
jgi:hypothetical protein